MKKLCSLLLLLLPAISAQATTITRTSTSIFYIDVGENLNSAYTSYLVTNNDGVNYADVWVQIGTFTGGVVGLNANETSIHHLGAMNDSEVRPAFFYLTAAGTTNSAQGHTIRVYNGYPGVGTLITSSMFTFTSVENTIAALANQVNTLVTGPNPSQLGGVVTVTVSGQTGTIGAANVLAFTPATFSTWPASSYILTGSVITLQAPNAGTFTNTLLIPASSITSSANTSYTLVYSFVTAGVISSPQFVSPIGYISSGTQIKHTATAGFTNGTYPPVQPATNSATLAKSVSPTSFSVGGTSTWTLTVNNPSTSTILLDRFIDQMPGGVTYLAGSASYNGVAQGDPDISGQTLSWSGTYSIPANAARSFTYQSVIPNSLGSYTNSAYGLIGTTHIDMTADVSNNSNATATVTVSAFPPVANDDIGATLIEDGANGTINIIANDTDMNGNPTAPTNGAGQFTVDLNTGLAGIQTTITNAQGAWTYTAATGVVTFDPANNYNGTASIAYELCDPTALCDQANITFTVTPVNDPPVANDDTGAPLTEDGANGTVSVLSNDSDVDGNPTAPTNGAGQFTVDLDTTTPGLQTSFTNATGAWTYNAATGDVTFDPANNYNGTATITYQLCDPGALCDPATISFTVSPVNDPPVANDDAGAALSEDGANGTVGILGNDTDVDGNPPPGGPTNGAGQFTVDLDLGTAGLQTTLTNATGAWIYNTATGVVTFDPANNYNGTAVITYQLCDPSAACDPATITFVVTPVNDPPVANDDNGGSLTEDGANGTVSIFGNDTDVDGNPTAPTNGAGQFTVDLDLGAAGLQTSFTDATGVWTYNSATGVVTFDPTNNYNGTATITYQLCDPGAACDPATITFTVTPVNDPPVANDDSGTSVAEDGANSTVSILTNDTDNDGDPTAPTNGVGQFTVDIDPSSAGIQTALTNATGVWTCNTAIGVVTFDPANNYNGTAVISYELCDPASGCDQATITVVVTPVNDTPVANDDNGGSLTEDGANGTVNILSNDTDNDGNPAAPTNGAGQFTVDLDLGTAGLQTSFTGATGVWTYNAATGVVTFDPANDYNGTAMIAYQLCDPSAACDPANITFTVTAVNDAPVANDDTGASVAEDGANGTVNIITNDTDVDGNPTAPTNGAGQFTVDLDLGTAGLQTTFTNATGVWSYTTATGVVTFDPANDYNGTAVINYQLCDPSASCDPANITFTVTAVNDAPVANDDTGTSVAEDDANATVSILTNDTDNDGNPTAPTNGAGQFTVDMDIGTAGIQTSYTNATGTWTYAPATGVVTFDPANNYNGTAVIPYQLCDPSAACDQANISFLVSAVNDPPVANDDNESISEGGTLTDDVASNDSDIETPNSGLVWTLVDGSNADANGTLVFNANGTYTYMPDLGYNGTATFTYQVCDPGPLCDLATVTITIGGVNDPPAANNDMGPALAEDGANGTVNILANDTDLDGNPTTPTNGAGQFTVDLDPSTAGLQTTLTNATGVWTYNPATGVVTFDPANNYNGTATIAYELCDPTALCDQANITFTVTPVNDTPVANDDTGAPLAEDGSNGSVGILSNDTDVDGNPTTPTNGAGQFTVDLDTGTPGLQTSFTNATGVWTYSAATGDVTFDPANNYNGTATITYQLCDPNAACDLATITFVVSPVNDAPIANNDTGTSVPEDGANSTANILANDTDVDGNPTAPTNGAGQFTVDLDPGTAGIQTTLTNAAGEWTYNPATGVVTFDPANNFNGMATIPYELCDPASSCDQANITFTVTSVNDAPVANDDNGGSLTEDGANGTVSILTNDTDNDGNPTAPTNGAGQFTVDLDPSTAGIQTTLTNAAGVWSYNPATGVVTFDPANNFNGPATLSYELCDPSAACDQAIITFVVDPSNDPPVAGDDGFSTNEDVPIPSTSLTGNDTDIDNTNGELTWSLLSGGTAAANGTLLVNANGTFTYVPNGNFNGVVSFTYQVCDPAGACDPATVTITVNPVNDPPVANDDSFSTNEDASLTTQSLTGNDSDPDNSAAQLSWSLVSGGSAAANGTLVLNANGTFSYTPNANFNGVVSFTYQVCDPSAACDPATGTITVNPVNDTPVALDDSYSTNEDVASIGQSVGGNDSDVETPNGSLVWSLLGGGTAATNGTLLFNANGTFNYTPTLNFTGTVSFTYQVCDPANACDPATVTISVGPVNDPPVAGDDAFTVNEDASLSNEVLSGNDSDVDNTSAQLTWSLVSGGSAAANGTLTVNPNGTFSYAPNANFNGTVTFTYQVCDAGPLCDPATVTITVVPVNDTPVANDDGFSMSEDGTLSNTTATNDSDIETANTGLAWSIVDAGSAGANGTLLLNADGTFTYAPNADFTGTVSFTYQVCDPANACDPAVVTIVVNAVNDPPVAGNDPFSVNEDATLSGTVTGNDSDVESPNSALTWSLVTGGTAAANGSLVLNANGGFTYTPSANYFGTVTFTYQVCDPQNACVQATATIFIAPVNDAPVANDDGLTSPEDQVLNASITGNDSDVDNTNGQLTWTLTSGGSAAANGTLTFNADGTFSYTPNLDFIGVVSFTYQVCDPAALCDPATVTINIGGTNDAPVANNDGFSTPEDNTLTATVIGNDSDADGDPLTFTVVNGGTAAANGTLAMAADGSFTYVPNPNFNGSVQFTYQACDPSSACDQALVTIVVTPVNDPPVANDDGYTTNEDVAVSASLGGNDSDTETPNTGLTWSLINGGSATANGILTINADGTFTYVPNANFNGSVSFTYQVCDPANSCDQAFATITVNAVNDAPVANDDAFTMVEDGTLTDQNVTGNDADTETPNASLVWSLVSGGSASANGALTFNSNGTFTYVPTANFNGTVTFTYQVCDPGPLCDVATVTITVDPANDTPVANDDAFSVNEDAVLSHTVASNDSDADHANAQLTWTLISGGTAASNGTLLLNADGTFTYAPNANFNGVVTFVYQACDPLNACDQATVTITVAPVNDSPVANDDNATVPEDGVLTAAIGGNDSDIDNTNGQLVWSLLAGGSAATNGTLVFNSDGTYTYTPNADFNGPVQFTYQVCDPINACDPATVFINVTPINDTPVANDDVFSVAEDGALNADVTGNDSDTETPNASLSWSLVSGGTAAVNGTLTFNTDGTFSYVPSTNFNGTVTFTYQLCDPSNVCDAATVTITVGPVNDPPVALNDSYGVIEDGTLVNNVSGNDGDVDNMQAQLTWSVVAPGSAGANGTLTFNADGSFTYVPDPGFNGIVSFTYQVCDPSALCDPAIVTMNVGSDNDAPIAGDDAFLINEDGVIISTVAGGDSDPDGDPMTWSLVSGGTAATNGTLVLNADGTFTYAPNANFNGTVSFTYEVCDPLSFCDPAVVTIVVLPVNDAPVAGDDNFSLPEDGSLANTVVGNDSDVEGPLTWSLVDGGTAAANGVLVFNADGTFTYTPNADFFGTVSFTYQACDPGPLCDEATVTITVTPSNDAPVADDDAFTMDEEGTLSAVVTGNDSDVDDVNSDLTWVLVSGGIAATSGTLTFIPNGSFTYVPNTNFYGTVSFTYQICDASGVCDPAEVIIDVLPMNDPPVAVDDNYGMAEGGTLNDDLGVNDSDLDGDALTWSLVNGQSAAGNGTLAVNADGTFTYTPNAGFNGTVAFTYQACDLGGLCDQALVIITIDAVNDAPSVQPDNATTNEDTPIVVDVLANDSDSDGDLDEGSVTIAQQPNNGTVTVNVDGTITYTPGPDFTGTDAFEYQVCDNGTPLPAQCATAFVDITVLPVNDPPTAFDEGYSTLEDDATLNADVTGNDYDIDNPNSELAWSLLNGGTAGQNGVIVFNPNGTFTYTPNANFYGYVSFTYHVCDPSGLCDPATVFIDVQPVNDPPIAVGDYDNTLPNVVLTTNVSANDNDTADVSTIDLGSITIIVPPDSGSVVVNGNGTITYTPNAGFVGLDTLIYEICDVGVPLPALCDTAILIINVTDAYPLAYDDNYNLLEDSSAVLNVLENDTTITGVIVPSSVGVVSGPYHGTANANVDGTVTYVPDANYDGPDAFNYTLCTDLGFCSFGTVLIYVDPVNDPPIALNDTTSTNEEVLVNITVLNNDNDLADGFFGGIDSTTVTIITPAANGVGSVNVDGTITYQPNADFNGIDSLQYAVCDVGFPLPPACDTAWAFILVDPVNDPPVVLDTNGTPADTLFVTTLEDAALQICFTATDVEGDTLDATNSFLGPDFGTITGEADGDTCITYTPDANYNGGDTVTVVVCDNNGLCDTVVVVIDVTPVNDPPQVVDVVGDPTDTLNASTPEDTPITICLDAIDVDGDSLQVTSVAGGLNNGTASGLSDGDTCWTYTPDPDFNGTDSVQVVVCDNNGGCDTVLVIINVTPVNDPPVIADGTGTSIDTLNVYTLEDLPVEICFTVNDVDGDSLDVISVPYGPFAGVATGLQDGDTCITYTPDAGYNGGDTLIAVVGDGNGGTDTVVVIINVFPENDPPVITDGGGTPIDTLNTTTPEDTPLQICLDAIDPEGLPLDATSYTVVALNGAITGLANGDTCITYTPFPNYTGNDSVYVFVCDVFNACDSVLVIIEVTPVNDPPVIVDGGFMSIDTLNVTTGINAPATICLNALDIDGDTLDVTAVLDGPLNGVADSYNDGDTCFTYTPNTDYLGTDTLTAVVCDNNGGCDTVLVIVTVVETNNPPVITDGNGTPIDTLNATTPEDTPITICLTAIDIDGDTLDVTGVFNGPLNGTITGIEDGDTCFTYTPSPSFNGSDTVSVVVCDNNGGCDTVLVIIDVTPVNDPPIAVDDAAGTDVDTPVTITVLGNDSDPNGDPIMVTSATASNGTVVINGNGTITYTPATGFCGTDTITYTICDPGPLCDQAIVVVAVSCINNDPPVAVDDAASTEVDTEVIINVVGNDSDPNGDPITITNASASNGAVVINGFGSITYTPATGFCGTDTIFYTICDPEPLCDQAIVVVTVACPPVNDPPIAVNDSTITDQGETVNIDVLDNDSDPNGDPLTVTSADAANGSVVINNDGTLTYTPASSFCGTDTIFYTICDPEPLCDQAIVLVEVECIEPLMIPNGFSPNGDGIADTWVIQGLQHYPNASVLIFNRWGNQVYSADPYMNDWNGVSNNALTIGEVLPAGTYWFLVDLGVDGEEVRSGYIYLNK